MGQTIYQVDAFTSVAFKGNPAAVCVMEAAAGKNWMQLVAREMNLSETAFVVAQDDGFNLRWFTPVTEVDLCGHATLASAHILWETGMLEPSQAIHFHSRSGLLSARRRQNIIELDFPATPDKSAPLPNGLAEALQAKPIYAGRSRFDYILELDSEETVRRLQPDMMALKQLDVRGVIVTSRSSSPEFDFISRFFAPAAGVDEDPVTGSAHCCLGPYWQRRMQKSDFKAFQASERGGEVWVRMAEDRVLLGGEAVTVMRGELND